MRAAETTGGVAPAKPPVAEPRSALKAPAAAATYCGFCHSDQHSGRNCPAKEEASRFPDVVLDPEALERPAQAEDEHAKERAEMQGVIGTCTNAAMIDFAKAQLAKLPAVPCTSHTRRSLFMVAKQKEVLVLQRARELELCMTALEVAQMAATEAGVQHREAVQEE